MSTLENAQKQAAFTAAFIRGVVRVGVVVTTACKLPAHLTGACVLNFNSPIGARDCFTDAACGISETLSFNMQRQRVSVPWDNVGFIEVAATHERLYPRADSADSEQTRLKIKAAIEAKTTGLIGIGFNPHDPAVVVPRGTVIANEGRTQTKLIFNGGYGDLHINAEGIQETLKFLGDAQAPDVMIHCFIPWGAVSVVAEENSAAIRFECSAPKWEDVRRDALERMGDTIRKLRIVPPPPALSAEEIEAEISATRTTRAPFRPRVVRDGDTE